MLVPILDDDRMLDAIGTALREDIGPGDLTTQCTVPPDLAGTGVFVAKANGVLSGLTVAATVLHMVEPSLTVDAEILDGMPLLRGMTIATARGSIASMLTAERTALNFLQRMSGIATATAAYVKLVEGFPVDIMDTRKTAPGLRTFDKAAVKHGRGVNHRYGLSDMVLIKDNHVAAAGGIRSAVELVRGRLRTPGIRVEVEADTLQQALEAASCEGVDVILLDNFSIDDMAEAVRLIRTVRRDVRIEASGNVTERTVRDIASTGVDCISIGALTHSVRALDVSFDIVPAE